MTQEKQYLDIASLILKTGQQTLDRTGVGTQSIFGTRMEFDISNSFPLLTTKKLWFKGIIEELIWFISGKTNIRPLQQKGVHIWDEWASPEGALGPVYGKQWRRWEKVEIVQYNLPISFFLPEKDPSKLFGYGFNDVINTDDERLLYPVWKGLLENAKNFAVDPSWFDFQVFVSEVTKLPNWILKKTFPDEYSLDVTCSGYATYAPGFCRWSKTESISSSFDSFYTASKSEKRVTFKNLALFCSDYGIDLAHASYFLEQSKPFLGAGWVITKRSVGNSRFLVSVQTYDQLHSVISQIKHNPSSRRILFSSWNPGDLENMALPPCHVMMQFYVDQTSGSLSGQLTQRSVDWFLGCPYNIASYAALIYLIAAHTGLKPGKLICTGGDAHIYSNHVDQMNEQIAREPFDFPSLTVIPQQRLEDYRLEHFILAGYQSHSALKGKIAV